jgi:hypothetical protein
MAKSNRYPTYATCVEQVLSTSESPLTVEEVVDGVRRCRPLSKGARSAIDRALDSLFQAVPMAESRFGWLPQLLNGSVVRHTLESSEIRGSFILLDELEHALFFPRFFQNLEAEERSLQIDLFGEETIGAQLAPREGMWALGFTERLAQWLDEAGASPGDDLLITAVDVERGRYSVRIQPVEARDEPAIHERNGALALAAEEAGQEILCRRSALYTWQLVARLVGRGLFRDRVPPDDLHFVLEEYSRLHLIEGFGYELQIADGSADESLLGGADVRPAPNRPKAEDPATTRPAGGRSGRSGIGGAPSARREPPADSGRPESGRPANPGSIRSINGRIVFGPGAPRPPFPGRQGDAMKSPFGSDDPLDDSCEAYDEYLAAFQESRRAGDPFSHDDFHLLEAELESLVDLELEFGYLMADQNQRKMDLADRLFIDPETLVDGAWDEGEDLDDDNSILWN